MFKKVNSRVNFPQLEKEVLQYWKDNDVFKKSEEGANKPLFMLYEGPPTANGSPGIHHVLARVFKDIICRYKTMKGYRPLRKGGWDTHGLPVELEVERELGLKSKRDIEEYGIERFNQKCRESVFRYVKEWEDLTDRIGFWVDMEHPYVTLDNSYIETGWWILKQMWDRDLIYKGMKGTPHCPRCVTSLSSHEVALGYEENTPDPSVYVKLPILGWEQTIRTGEAFYEVAKHGLPIYLLAWTTTPWTLPGNTALAVDPSADYSLVEVEGPNGKEKLLLASALVEEVIKEPHEVLETFKGGDLAALTYRKLYDPTEHGIDVHQFRRPDGSSGEATVLESVDGFTPRVFPGNFVSLEEGTGIVHIAPAFGDEDLTAGRQHGLAFVQPVDLQGIVTGTYPFAGKFVKDADEEIMADLKQRGLLYHRGVYRHTYPFCWRCNTPLLYYAKESWYIRTTAVKDRLISNNQEINWYP
ncbi:MAG: class I tRNA ligase family protein, partial [Chloroflexi bacterium]|nr:class I tRNA ligase family protein [Chloroflexota bacterium]